MAVRGSSRDELTVELAPADVGRLLRDVKAFGPELMKDTRKRLRSAADAGVQDVRRRLAGRTFHIDAGLASGLAAGTKVSIKTGLRTAGVTITTTGVKLPEDKRAMVRAYNKSTFRHPVFGRDVWVTQKGRPYFGAVLDERKPAMRQAVEDALQDALKTIQSGVAR